jgi:N utilization substance protein A
VGAGEAIMRRNDKLPREAYRPGDRIRAYVKDVRRELRGPQIFLSRTAPEFMAELFKMEVPEIYEGSSRSRPWRATPGAAPRSPSSPMTAHRPVGACVGMRGSRVQAVVNELGGREDRHHSLERGPAHLPRQRAPARRGLEGRHRRRGRAHRGRGPEEQLSLAIGRRGQNVRLASQLTGLDIDILTEEQESKRRQAEFDERTRLFMGTLDLDEFFAQLLVAEGFRTVEEVAYVDQEELLTIDGVDEGTAEELQARARDHIEAQRKAALDRARALGVEESLINFPGLTPPMIEALAQDDVKTLEDFATCADWELAGGWTEVDGQRVKDTGILEKFDLSLEEARGMVMSARVALGWVDPDEIEAATDGRGGGGGLSLLRASA